MSGGWVVWEVRGRCSRDMAGGGGVAVTARVLEKGIDWLS